MRRTHINRGIALTGLVAAALTATLLPTPVTARAEVPAKPPVVGTVSHTNELSAEVSKLMEGTGDKAEAAALESYWTPARMKAAKPIDKVSSMNRAGAAPKQRVQTQPEGKPGSVPPAIKSKAPALSTAKSDTSAVTPQTSQPNLPYDHPAARTNGKVFFSRDNQNYVCSASIVNSENKSLVWTAGHCLAKDATWSYNVSFVPAYSNGSRPYGTWYAKNLTTTEAWFFNHWFDYDVGAATMNVNFGYRIADYLGAQGISWNQSANYTANAFGYPASSPYNGQYLWRADESTADAGDGTIYMYSGLTGGSSGGPWFRDFDGSWGYVNGHNDFIYTASPSWMYSPYYGDQVAKLYNAVRYETTILSLTSATPTISGTAKVGAKLTAKPGTWKPAPVTLTYRWKANGTTISRATATTFTVPAALKGKTITVTVTGSRPGYTTISKTSKATTKVASGTLTGVTPKITGTAKVGKILTTVPGSWKPAGTRLSYEWYRNSSKIKGATARTYRLVKADKGKKIRIKVTGRNTGYTTLTKTSATTKTVKA